MKLVCRECGTTFAPARVDSLYCTPECGKRHRNRVYRARNPEKARAAGAESARKSRERKKKGLAPKGAKAAAKVSSGVRVDRRRQGVFVGRVFVTLDELEKAVRMLRGED